MSEVMAQMDLGVLDAKSRKGDAGQSNVSVVLEGLRVEHDCKGWSQAVCGQPLRIWYGGMFLRPVGWWGMCCLSCVYKLQHFSIAAYCCLWLHAITIPPPPSLSLSALALHPVSACRPSHNQALDEGCAAAMADVAAGIAPLRVYMRLRGRLLSLFGEGQQARVMFTGVEGGKPEVLLRAPRANDPAYLTGGYVGGWRWAHGLKVSCLTG